MKEIISKNHVNPVTTKIFATLQILARIFSMVDISLSDQIPQHKFIVVLLKTQLAKNSQKSVAISYSKMDLLTSRDEKKI